MDDHDVRSTLDTYRIEKRISGKGSLAVVLHLSRCARDRGLPLNPDAMLTEGGAQVLGLGRGAVQKILGDHGIEKVLAEEGGRTSRGGPAVMRSFVAVLNELHRKGLVDISVVERYWIGRIREFFDAKPFVVRYDVARSMRSMIRELLVLANKRQRESGGVMVVGTMLQHLVGAKLQLALPELAIEHHGAATADVVSGRDGDFVLDQTAIHITTAPGESLIRKCERNLSSGMRAIIITTSGGVAAAESQIEIQELTGRIDVFDAEQFLAANLLELSLFVSAKQKQTVDQFIATYNAIIDRCETDPSLKIQLA